MINGQECIRVDRLEKTFPVHDGKFFKKRKELIHAVSNISFQIFKGETFGLVGESGCGKTTLGLCILLLTSPTGGKVFFQGQDLLSTKKAKLRHLRQKMQYIFQDPYGSLNPKWKVGTIIGEGLAANKIAHSSEREDLVDEIMKRVGLNPGDKFRYPQEFSGGQRQRIGIARALVLRPEFVIGDEVVSALDVSIQAQILNLLTEFQREYRFSCLMISHDLSVIKYLSDRVAVMYLGRIVEIAKTLDLYNSPKHPYTEALLSAVPSCDPHFKKEKHLLNGDIPSPINPPKGCRFHTRCPKKFDTCERVVPQLSLVGSSHQCACHLYGESMS